MEMCAVAALIKSNSVFARDAFAVVLKDEPLLQQLLGQKCEPIKASPFKKRQAAANARCRGGNRNAGAKS